MINLNKLILIQFFIVSPFLMMPNLLFNLRSSDLIEILKILEFILLFILIIKNYTTLNIKIFIYVSVLFILSLAVSIIYHRSSNEILYMMITSVSWFLLFINIKFHKINTIKLILRKIAYYNNLMLTLLLSIVLIMPNEIYAGERSVWFYLADGPNASSFAILNLFLFTYLAYSLKIVNKKMFFYSLIITIILLFGYKVRAIEVILIFILLYHSILQVNISIIRILYKYLLYITIAAVSISLIAFLSSEQLSELSSGRTVVWLERIEILKNYTFTELFFGKGYGADIMTTSQWWWEAKASHNDFLSIVFNYGLLGLLLVLGILYTMFKYTAFSKNIVLIIFISSMLTTGYISRPLSFLYILLLYVLYISFNMTIRKTQLKEII